MRAAVLSLALAAMTAVTLCYLGCAVLSDAPVNEPGHVPVYDENGYFVRSRNSGREIFLPDSPQAWHPLVERTDALEIRRVSSPMKANAPRVATLHADGTVTLEPVSR